MQALRQTQEASANSPSHSAQLWPYALSALILGVFHHMIRLGSFTLSSAASFYLLRATTGGIAVLVVLATSKVVDLHLIERLEQASVKYNLRRILGAIVWCLIGLIVVSVMFADWYTAVVSVGMVSLTFGFALQTPITSLLGWIYILVRAPYRVGDRIKLGNLGGDVIDVSYFDTTLWEFGGDYLSTDHPSGRIIRIPNSCILNSAVINYTWPLFPYIWNEIKVQVGYDSDLEFVATTMRDIAQQELGAEMRGRVKLYRDLLAKTPVDELEVTELPSVYFRINENSWIDATVRYLVLPREAGRVKSSLILKMLTALNQAPDRVRFPQGNAR